MKKKTSNKNHSITFDYIIDKSLTEIDFVMRDEILGKDWDTKKGGFGHINLNQKLHNWAGESSPVKIDNIIKLLEDFKKEGCNYVEIMYHCDHIGYYFNGLDIHRSTDQEIKEENKWIEETNKKRKDAEIKGLKEKLARLIKS